MGNRRMSNQRNLRLWAIIGFCIVALLLGFLAWRLTQPERRLEETGGVRVVLQVEPLIDSGVVTASQLETVRAELEHGDTITAYIIDGNRIVAELPNMTDADTVADIIVAGLLLELVDGGDNPPKVGDILNTSLGKADGATSEKIWTTIISGDDIDDSTVKVIQDKTSQYAVTFRLRGIGSQRPKPATAKQDYIMPVLLNKHVVSVPRVSVPITDGKVVLKSFTQEEANRLARQIRYATLPVKLRVVESTVVPPAK